MSLSAIAIALKAGRLLGIALLIGAFTWIDLHVPLNVTTAGCIYLLVVLLTATFGELWEAVFASLASAACISFYLLPPLFRFAVEDPQNWALLVAFLTTAIVVSQLSLTAKSQKVAALERSREMEQLYGLSRAVLLNTSPHLTAIDAVQQIARIFECTGVLLLERSTGQVYRTGALAPQWDASLQQAAIQATFRTDSRAMTMVTSILLESQIIGSMVLQGKLLSNSALQSITNLVAIALERARLIEISNAADLIRKSEELRATLLDAIAHEFKTPLTSIKAAASALRSGVTEAPARQELIEIVDEEADRLKFLVNDTIRMARIEAGELRLQKHQVLVSDVISSSVASLAGVLDGHAVTQNISSHLTATADAELVQLALKQVLDNALKYSPAGSPIDVDACPDGDDVLITVTNQGPGVGESEQGRIFDRYYRSSRTRDQVPGTGMGLAIARDIVVAHGGRIWAESNAGSGCRIRLLLPAVPMEAIA